MHLFTEQDVLMRMNIRTNGDGTITQGAAIYLGSNEAMASRSPRS